MHCALAQRLYYSTNFRFLYLQLRQAVRPYVLSLLSFSNHGWCVLTHRPFFRSAVTAVKLVCAASSPTVCLSKATSMLFMLCSWSTDYHRAFACSVIPHRVSQQSQPLLCEMVLPLTNLSASSLAKPCNVGITFPLARIRRILLPGLRAHHEEVRVSWDLFGAL